MYKYVIKRLLMLIPVVIGISFIIFSILNLTPGDAATVLLGDDATPEAAAALRESLGLNDPFFTRYFRFLIGALHGDFGTSYRTGSPVIKEIAARFPQTLRLATMAITLSATIGVLIGILSAIKRYSIMDNATLVATLMLTSMPDFWLGLMLILLLSVKLNILPSIGGEGFKGYIMPAIAACANSLAGTIRMTRSSMLEVVRQDYITTARAMGIDERKVIFQHALKNALLPVVTLIGINLGFQLAGTIVIEQVFAINGIGSLMITSIRMKDTPVVMVAVMFICILSSLINLLADLLYALIDPRIKAQYSKG